MRKRVSKLNQLTFKYRNNYEFKSIKKQIVHIKKKNNETEAVT